MLNEMSFYNNTTKLKHMNLQFSLKILWHPNPITANLSCVCNRIDLMPYTGCKLNKHHSQFLSELV